MRGLPLILALAACHGDDGDKGDTDTDTDVADTQVTAPTPTLTIVAPAAGATVDGPDVDVVLDVTDFPFVAPEAAARSTLPVGPAWTWLLTGTAAAHEVGEAPEGYVQLTLDDDAVTQLTAETTTLVGLSAGSHHLEAELLYPDGDSFYPAILADVTFTVVLPD